MPRKNVIKQDLADSFQHVYARGHSRHKIFNDEQDYITFLTLLQRYLSAEEARDPYGVPYPNFYNKLELLAFVLMPNHFHLLIYQRQPEAMARFMQSLLTSYSRYFNKKYKRSGSLFESRYKASMISDDSYLEHISRYIHLNPRQWRDYEYSSLPYYLQRDEVSWIRPKRILELFESSEEYLEFTSDYVEQKKIMDILKQELANEI
ncbi:MAG TPA: transposase [Candidatus Saccharimonadia bacterium]|nr:transposase [Candidatus Saccharimonadia bacterium]